MKQITAEHCAAIHPYLQVQRGNVRIPNIAVINAILHVLENGCKRRGGWYAKIRMVSASDRHAMIFAYPTGRPTARPKAASCWKVRTSRSRT